jgi:hypothetical protein
MRLRLYHARYIVEAGPLIGLHAEGKFLAGHQTNTAMPRSLPYGHCTHDWTGSRGCWAAVPGQCPHDRDEAPKTVR